MFKFLSKAVYHQFLRTQLPKSIFHLLWTSPSRTRKILVSTNKVACKRPIKISNKREKKDCLLLLLFTSSWPQFFFTCWWCGQVYGWLLKKRDCLSFVDRYRSNYVRKSILPLQKKMKALCLAGSVENCIQDVIIMCFRQTQTKTRNFPACWGKI